MAHLFEPFVQMDAIRLLGSWFGLWVHMDEMESQGVIKCHFPCPRASQILDMHDAGLRCKHWLNPIFVDLMLPMRGYFGEEITFYFKYGAYLIYSFVPLGIVGMVFALLRQFSIVHESKVDSIKTGLAALISIWAACISQTFARHASRVQQLWNVARLEFVDCRWTEYNNSRLSSSFFMPRQVKERADSVQTNPGWDERRGKECCTVFVNFCTIVFVLIYIGVVAKILLKQYDAEED